jgi:hypothetical protein
MSVATVAMAAVAAGGTAYSAAQQRAAMSDAQDMLTPFQMMRKTAKVTAQTTPQNLQTELDNRLAYDQQFLDHQFQLQQKYAPMQAQQALDINRELAPQYLALQQSLLEQSDPNAAAAQKLLGETAMSELGKGREMTDAQRFNFMDNIRGAQVARGNFTGNAAAFDEALKMSGYGDNLLQQRMSNAANFLSNVPSKTQMSVGLPNAFQPINSNAMGANYRVTDPDAWAKAQGYQGQSNQINAQLAMAPQTNPWTAGLGAATGVGLGYMNMQNRGPQSYGNSMPAI